MEFLLDEGIIDPKDYVTFFEKIRDLGKEERISFYKQLSDSRKQSTQND